MSGMRTVKWLPFPTDVHGEFIDRTARQAFHDNFNRTVLRELHGVVDQLAYHVADFCRIA
jgi:hypothetical protein